MFIASPVSESEDFAYQSPLQHSFVVLSDDDPLPFLDTAERDALSSTPPLHLPEKVRGLTESVEIRKRLETYLRDLAAPPENCALCRPCAAELETAVASEIDSNRERITRYEDELNRIKEEVNKGGDDAEHKKKRNGGNGRISNRPWMDAKVFGDEDCITQKTNKTVKASSEALDAELEELRKLGWEYTEVEATVWEEAEPGHEATEEGGRTSAPSSSSAQGGSPAAMRTCTICLENEADAVLYRCGHRCACLRCAYAPGMANAAA